MWNDISKELTSKFLTGGQCNPDARAAIRLIFHDCGGGSNTHLLDRIKLMNLSLEYSTRSKRWLRWQSSTCRRVEAGREHWPRRCGSVRPKHGYKMEHYRCRHDRYVRFTVFLFHPCLHITVFSGNHAIVTCPGGPQVKTFIGRKDSTTPAPDGLLPDVNAPAADLFKLFQDKGFNAVDLAALLGAHTSSNQFNFNTSADAAGKPQDSTPGVWDVKYYAETIKPPKDVVVFPSDAKLAAHPQVGKEFKGFVDNQGKWNGKFADAMGKMALFGSDGTKGLVDCTGALPRATNAKREMRGMPLFARRH